MDESQNYILVWSNGAGEISALSNYDLPESDPDFGDPENVPLRAYTRNQLRATDWIFTCADQVKALVTRATPQEPIAVPISTVRELEWFSGARYRGFVI